MAWDYEKQKEYMAEKNRQQSRSGRDIGPLPKVKNAKRRKKCEKNFRLFCETYFAPVFKLEWSDDHLKVIAVIEDAVLRGGLAAIAMSRGAGKSQLCKRAVQWSILYGHRSFAVVIGATEKAAEESLEDITNAFEHNDLLLEDFPEVCHPIRQLEGIPARQRGQLLNGQSTRIKLNKKELVLPTVPQSKASGAVIRVAGITGRIRGMSAPGPDGKPMRPSIVIIDDPSTEESARSPQGNQHRLTTINGAILGLAGPGEKIAGFAAVTVIQKDDLADKLLDRKAYPQWQGQRCKLLQSMPTNLKAWEKYAEIRANGLRAGDGLKPATAYYIDHKPELDAGAIASWRARYNHDEASAVQHAMNKKLDDEITFFAEYQNEPLAILGGDDAQITPEAVQTKVLSAYPRARVPDGVVKLTAFIDVQKDVLFWAVCGWKNDFTGHVVDYGCFPEQGRNYFTLSEVTTTFAKLKPHDAWEGQLYFALDSLVNILGGKQWIAADGQTHHVSRILIDANWGQSTGVVKTLAKQSTHKSLILPSHGVGITADKKPFGEYRPEDGVRVGWNWRNNVKDNHIRYDTNAWKTFVKARLLAGLGELGTLTICGGSELEHKLLAEQLASEYAVQVMAKDGRAVDIWRLKPNRENHWLDCLIGCAVGASEQGVVAFGHQSASGKVVRATRRKLEVTF